MTKKWKGKTNTPGRRRVISLAVGACLGAGLVAPGAAFEINTGNDELVMRWDNTVRYNIGQRIDGVNPRIGRNTIYDDSDYKFKKGQIVTNRFDLLSEFEVAWNQQYGARVSAAAWYDNAYKNTSVKQNPALPVKSGYQNNQYSEFTKRWYKGPSGEFLDAFVYGNLDLGGTSVNAKLGQLSTYWGQALFNQGGIASSQQPIDGRKGAATPGTEVRETFLPLKQIALQSQLTPMVSVAAQYYFDWDHIRVPEGGTYLGATDLLFGGPNQTSGNGRPGSGGNGLPFNPTGYLGPEHKSGNWGINTKVSLPEYSGLTLGFYVRKYDEKNGFWLLRNPASPLSYHPVFARDVDLYGMSADWAFAGISMGSEILTRRNASLNTVGFAAANEGARGNIWLALINGAYLLPNNGLWQTGTVAAELSYESLDKITKNKALYNAEGTTNCPLGRFNGCATKDALAFNISFTPQWTQVFPGADLSIPITWGGGLHGNSPTANSGMLEQVYSYSIGASVDYLKQYTASLVWADSSAKIIATNAAGTTFSGSSGFATTDRGRVTLTLKASF